MRTRFAPSPTGELHLGHAYSALTAWKAAGQSEELFCLRIDDLDHTRCHPAYTKQIEDDLGWLGLQWAEAPLVQSLRLQRYAEALQKLNAARQRDGQLSEGRGVHLRQLLRHYCEQLRSGAPTLYQQSCSE